MVQVYKQLPVDPHNSKPAVDQIASTVYVQKVATHAWAAHCIAPANLEKSS